METEDGEPSPPRVSVVIPARNEEEWIAAALASVAAQTLPACAVEAVVVDNGSCDGTAAAVRAFGAAHPSLRLRVVSEPDPGVARARNRGARAAGGRLLLFLDADSRMAPDLAEWVVRRAAMGYPAGSVRIVADGDDRFDHGFFRLLEFGKVLFGIRAQMFYCERELFLRAGGFDEEIRVAEDREFLARLIRDRTPVCHLTESWIATSPRRLHGLPFHLSAFATLGRWALAQAGIGRRWRY
ncbi:MAG TPA: glycosyltransferase [Thermomicrobiaceae bacterium]|nr:glycosyltransferase [Thermomicrobiaceae bacterium]